LHQELSGPGGREFAWIELGGDGYLVQVQFILGTREEPRPQLDSIIYRWTSGTLVPVQAFQTTGGTDAAFFKDGDHNYLAISNSLSDDLRFKSESRVYRFQP
jgi:EPTP domain-containing protein